MSVAYAELGCRSNFTLLDGASHPGELVVAASVLGHAGVGICDTNSLAGAVRGHVAAREAGIAYAVGCRLQLEDGAEYLVWPTDRASFGRLTRLLSLGRMRSPKGECALTRDEMIGHAEGWCMAAVSPVRPNAAFADRLRADAPALRSRLALPLLCTATIRFDDIDEDRLEALAEMTAFARVDLLATNDVRYHVASRRRLADVLTAIRLGRPVDRLGPLAEPNAERHLKEPAEMARLFRRAPAAPGNTLRVLEACRGFSLSQLRHEYPDEIIEPGRTPQQTLEGRVAEACGRRFPRGVPADIQGRIDHELRLIERLDYAPYFLTVDEVVRFARDQDILCQGRGSAANSSVCYVLGITAVDPSKHDLLFERFLSAERAEPPDIDVDFEHERREEVIQFIYRRYGRDRAAIVGTVIRFRGRSAVREVGKVLGLSEDVTGRLAKASWGPERDSSLAEIAAAEGLDLSDRRLGLALELAEEIQDFPRHLATHVGGFVMSRGPLIEMAVVGNAAMDGRTVLEMGWTAPGGTDVPKCGSSASAAQEASGMSITMIGLDTAKAVFQVHALNLDGKAVSTHKLRRDQLVPFFEKLDACTVVMEACGAAHHWGRLLSGLGHDVRLIPSEAVRPFVKRGRKNDAADAAAICEAASRPNIKFVPVKSLDQQGTLALHSARSLLVKQQTMLANAMRGLATEFGMVVSLGVHKIGQLMLRIEEEKDLPDNGRLAMRRLHERFIVSQESIEALEKLIVGHARSDGSARRLATIPGIGPITASLIAATIADIRVFESSRKFAAWLGLVPRQHSTGGKTRLGRITKAGNRDIRTLLVLGATSMIRRAHSWKSVIGAWARSALERRPVRLVSVALANKMARMVWALLTHDEIYHPQGRAIAAA